MTPALAYGPSEPPQCAKCGQRKLRASGGPWLQCDGKVGPNRCWAWHYSVLGEGGYLAVAYVSRDLREAAHGAPPADAMHLLRNVLEAAARALSEVDHDRSDRARAA